MNDIEKDRSASGFKLEVTLLWNGDCLNRIQLPGGGGAKLL